MKKVLLSFVITMLSVFSFNAQIKLSPEMDEARLAFNAEQFEKARGLFEKIVQSDINEGLARFYLGYILVTVNDDPATAKPIFESGLLCPDRGNINYIGLALINLNDGDVAAADANFALATKKIKKKSYLEYMYMGIVYSTSAKPNPSKAIEILTKAKDNNPNNAEVHLALGNAYRLDKNQNDAYVSYRKAFELDNKMLLAKMKLGVLLKGAHSFEAAVNSFNEVVALDVNFGPVYREIAETQYVWAINDKTKYKEHIAEALAQYQKYMSLTDYSLASRMRYADFLILAKEYKALEVEAKKMAEIDNVNPKIYRYLAYSAYHNTNYQTAISSLNIFLANPKSRIIGKDYFYMGAAKIMNAIDKEPIDTLSVSSAIIDLRKAAEKDIQMTNEMPDIGKKLHEKKIFNQSAAVFEIAIQNEEGKTHIADNFYFGMDTYWAMVSVDSLSLPQVEKLRKADLSLKKVVTESPSTQDAYLFKARINFLIKDGVEGVKNYEDYITCVTNKGEAELGKKLTQNKIMEAYNNSAVYYTTTSENEKAKEYFNKVLVIDPNNEFALESLKMIDAQEKAQQGQGQAQPK